jgi:hypothetical protein
MAIIPDPTPVDKLVANQSEAEEIQAKVQAFVLVILEQFTVIRQVALFPYRKNKLVIVFCVTRRQTQPPTN